MYDNTDTDRARGVKVYPMPESIGGPAIFGSYALMVRRDDEGKVDYSEVRMVHTEGVGYKVTDEKPWVWTDYAEVPEWTPEELVLNMDFAAEVDLADWVRSHNYRLESNFRQLYTWATVNNNEKASN